LVRIKYLGVSGTKNSIDVWMMDTTEVMDKRIGQSSKQDKRAQREFLNDRFWNLQTKNQDFLSSSQAPFKKLTSGTKHHCGSSDLVNYRVCSSHILS
jgi:hypothetical protein